MKNVHRSVCKKELGAPGMRGPPIIFHQRAGGVLQDHGAFSPILATAPCLALSHRIGERGLSPRGTHLDTLDGVAQILANRAPKSGTPNHSLDERELAPSRTHLDPPEGLVQILANRAGTLNTRFYNSYL